MVCGPVAAQHWGKWPGACLNIIIATNVRVDWRAHSFITLIVTAVCMLHVAERKAPGATCTLLLRCTRTAASDKGSRPQSSSGSCVYATDTYIHLSVYGAIHLLPMGVVVFWPHCDAETWGPGLHRVAELYKDVLECVFH